MKSIWYCYPQPKIELQPFADIVTVSLSAATFSDDLFKQALALDERLDAMIDRAIKV